MLLKKRYDRSTKFFKVVSQHGYSLMPKINKQICVFMYACVHHFAMVLDKEIFEARFCFFIGYQPLSLYMGFLVVEKGLIS